MHMHHYARLLAMTVLSYLAMFAAMYAMVDTWPDVYPNINQAYMAALMAAPMVVIEILLMWSMYKNTAANIAIIAAGVIVAMGSFVMIRKQTAVADIQFIKSMVPHHSGAILMCREARISDAELKTLCADITRGQRSEIVQMNAILLRLARGG
ncbi:MAG: DUF305 domain-containing protein [Xanthobacteraceae bacterium]|nr:DUF305 domain-containing protein [Xanthobacteraceae bacterium]